MKREIFSSMVRNIKKEKLVIPVRVSSLRNVEENSGEVLPEYSLYGIRGSSLPKK